MQKQTCINSIEDLKREYTEQFDKLGNFPGEAKLHIEDDAEPFIDAPRKCPIHIKDELKLEIDNLATQGVIRKVGEHTDLCSSLEFSTKKDGSMRIMPRSTASQYQSEKMSPQNPYSGRTQPTVCESQGIQQTRCEGWLLGDTP